MSFPSPRRDVVEAPAQPTIFRSLPSGAQSPMDIPDSARPLYDALRSTELLRPLEHFSVARLLEATTEEIVEKDQPIYNRRAILIVIEGTVNAYVSSRDGRRHASPGTSGRISSRAEERRLLKKVSPLSILNSMADLTSLLSQGPEPEPAVEMQSPKSIVFSDELVTFEAATRVKLAVVSLAGLETRAPEARDSMIKALLRRLYFDSIPLAFLHLRLVHEVLECEQDYLNLVRRASKGSSSAKASFDEIMRNHASYAAESPKRSPDLKDLPEEQSLASDDEAKPMLPVMPTQIRKKYSGPRVALPKLQTIGVTQQQPSSPSDFIHSASVLAKTERKMTGFKVLTPKPGDSINELQALTTESIFQHLGLYSPDALRSHGLEREEVHKFAKQVIILEYADGAYITHSGERQLGLFLVLRGVVTMSTAPDGMSDDTTIPSNEELTLGAGTVVGHTSLVTNNKSMFDLRAAGKTYIGLLPRKTVQKIAMRFPQSLLLLAQRTASTLHHVIQMVDFALDWSVVDAGKAMYIAGSASDAIYFIKRGRLRTSERMVYSGDDMNIEVCSGDSMGALDVYMQRPRAASCVAVRRSEVIKMQKICYKALAAIHPPLAMSLWDTLLQTAPGAIEDSVAVSRPARSSGLRTIAIVPLSVDVPVERFVTMLSEALVRTGIVSENDMFSVDSTSILKSMSTGIYSVAGNVQLENYVHQLQENVKLLLFIADHSVDSTWTDVCISNADCILFLATADSEPKIQPVEDRVELSGNLAQKRLVLLHTGESLRAREAQLWMKERDYITPTASIIKIMHPSGPSPGFDVKSRDEHADFERLARLLFNRSIALVLGGGGARGLSHLGVLQAFEEAGIPVDIIGGASMGAFVAANYAIHRDYQQTHQSCYAISRQQRLYKYLADITFPLLAITTGGFFSRDVKKSFGPELESADLKLDFYCSCTNLTNECQTETFYARPIPLWRMVRASMSVIGLVPPITIDGQAYVDGAFTSNVPVFPAQKLGAATIFAVDVGTPSTWNSLSLNEGVSGWMMLLVMMWQWLARLLCITVPESPTEPKLSDILSSLAFATNRREIRIIQDIPGCHYLVQQLQKYSASDFHKIDDICSIGYRATTEWIKKLIESGELKDMAVSIAPGAKSI